MYEIAIPVKMENIANEYYYKNKQFFYWVIIQLRPDATVVVVSFT